LHRLFNFGRTAHAKPERTGNKETPNAVPYELGGKVTDGRWIEGGKKEEGLSGGEKGGWSILSRVMGKGKIAGRG